MKSSPVSFALVIGLLTALYANDRAKRKAPDPYAACEVKPKVERDQCYNLVSFALSAGP